jgi:hypothetical protein
MIDRITGMAWMTTREALVIAWMPVIVSSVAIISFLLVWHLKKR